MGKFCKLCNCVNIKDEISSSIPRLVISLVAKPKCLKINEKPTRLECKIACLRALERKRRFSQWLLRRLLTLHEIGGKGAFDPCQLPVHPILIHQFRYLDGIAGLKKENDKYEPCSNKEILL